MVNQYINVWQFINLIGILSTTVFWHVWIVNYFLSFEVHHTRTAPVLIRLRRAVSKSPFLVHRLLHIVLILRNAILPGWTRIWFIRLLSRNATSCIIICANITLQIGFRRGIWLKIVLIAQLPLFLIKLRLFNLRFSYLVTVVLLAWLPYRSINVAQDEYCRIWRLHFYKTN